MATNSSSQFTHTAAVKPVDEIGDPPPYISFTRLNRTIGYNIQIPLGGPACISMENTILRSASSLASSRSNGKNFPLTY